MKDARQKPEADRTELHARLMGLAEDQSDPPATHERILREIVAWVKTNTAHSLVIYAQRPEKVKLSMHCQ